MPPLLSSRRPMFVEASTLIVSPNYLKNATSSYAHPCMYATRPSYSHQIPHLFHARTKEELKTTKYPSYTPKFTHIVIHPHKITPIMNEYYNKLPKLTQSAQLGDAHQPKELNPTHIDTNKNNLPN